RRPGPRPPPRPPRHALTTPRPPRQPQAVAAAGLAVYFAASAVLGVASGAERRWIWGWALPSVAAPLAVGAVSGLVEGWAVVALLLVVALWRVTYRQRGGTAQEGSVQPA
ncbi:hypothetical protein, partial [Nonomuraea sp. NPDC003201]